MVGADNAICVDWWAMGNSDTASVCRAEVEVLRAR